MARDVESRVPSSDCVAAGAERGAVAVLFMIAFFSSILFCIVGSERRSSGHRYNAERLAAALTLIAVMFIGATDAFIQQAHSWLDGYCVLVQDQHLS